MTPDVITPNADGLEDLARIEFILNRSAIMGITFYDREGKAYVFRAPARLGPKEEPYTVYFPGVVEGFTQPGEEDHDYTILRRTLPNGLYTWEIRAVPDDGEPDVVTGTLALKDADTVLPAIRGMTLSERTFSPNQDGIADRVQVEFELKKDVEELMVYLKGENDLFHYIAEDERVTLPNEKGWHVFDYDGGIDLGDQPPPDGIYTIYADARDHIGQRVVTSQTLEIVNAGLPRAYILNGEVAYSATSLVLSDTLCFTLTVENDSTTYIRTTGPWPGTTYRSDENFNTLEWAEESGVFRVGMDFDTSLRNYPFRWGIGEPGVDLVERNDSWYLPPKSRSEVTGCVQIVEAPERNPLYYWMGLIHEDVAIAAVNNHVDPNYVTIWEP